MKESNVKRFAFIDQVRGLAIALMVFFHFFYDLSFFKYIVIDFQNNWFWWGLPRVIVFLFLLSVGMSLRLVHYPIIQWKKFNKRLGLLILYASIISIATYILFPTRWIYFGTLHCIAFCSLISLPLISRPKLSFAIALLILTPAVTMKWNIPWFQLNHLSMDYIPPFPWIGVVCLGIFFVYKNIHTTNLPSNKALLFLEFIGKHPLKIYQLHQPILFGLTFLFHRLTQ